jgi:hypothetical protein
MNPLMAKKINPLLRWGCLTPILAIVTLFAVAFLWDKFVPSSVRRALPPSASEVKEFYWEAGVTGDFTRCLKAKLPESDFPVFAKNLGLKTRFDPKIHGNVPLADRGAGMTSEINSWWNPPAASGTTYLDYTPGDNYVSYLKYADGHVYFLAHEW